MNKSLMCILISILLSISPLFLGSGSTTAMITFVVKSKDIISKEIEKQEIIKEQEEQNKIEQEKEEEKLNTYGNFDKHNFDEYCVVYIPKTHFTKSRSSNVSTSAHYSYMDDDSYLMITYMKKLTDTELKNIKTDILELDANATEEEVKLGEISFIRVDNSNIIKDNEQNINNELNNTTESNTDKITEDTYELDDVEQSEESYYNKIVWYTVKSDSVLIISGYAAKDIDKQIFIKAVESGLDKTKIYYVSDIVLDTPTTGYYENKENK